MLERDPLVASRPIEPADQPVVDALVSTAADELRDQRGGELLFGVDRPLSGARDAAVGERVLELVGLIDDVVVGYARCQVIEVGVHRLACIDDLYVHPEARGIGVGAAMLASLRDQANGLGCTHLESQVLPGNREAKNFFERMGMVTRRMQVSTAL